MGQAKRRSDEIVKLKAAGPREQRAIAGTTRDGKEFTRAHVAEFENEDNIAFHEACHAVACWLVGEPNGPMKFADAGGIPADFNAITITGIPVPEMLASSIGERWVYARRHAFITLAGVYGSDDAWRDNPLSEDETFDHEMQAGAGFKHLLGVIDREELLAEIDRLTHHVVETFNDRRVRSIAKWLALQFIEQRELSGEQVTVIISQAWEQCDLAFREGEIGKEQPCEAQPAAIEEAVSVKPKAVRSDRHDG